MKMFCICCMLVAGWGCGGRDSLSIYSLKNAVYDIPEIGKITFTDGMYDREVNETHEQSTLHIGQIDLFAYGDLNGDGAEDAITFLSRKVGGPEIFLSMEVFLNDQGNPVHSGGIIIGDRVAIDSVTIQHQRINLYLITQAPDDAMCCPTLHVKKEFQFLNNQLAELPFSNKINERK